MLFVGLDRCSATDRLPQESRARAHVLVPAPPTETMGYGVDRPSVPHLPHPTRISRHVHSSGVEGTRLDTSSQCTRERTERDPRGSSDHDGLLHLFSPIAACQIIYVNLDEDNRHVEMND